MKVAAHAVRKSLTRKKTSVFPQGEKKLYFTFSAQLTVKKRHPAPFRRGVMICIL